MAVTGPAVEIEPHCWEFTCVECGRLIISIQTWRPEPCLCGLCLHMPGWHEDARLRELLDPDAERPP